MTPTDRTADLLDAINDAIANDNDRLVAELLAGLAELNRELVADGFEPLAVPAEWNAVTVSDADVDDMPDAPDRVVDLGDDQTVIEMMIDWEQLDLTENGFAPVAVE